MTNDSSHVLGHVPVFTGLDGAALDALAAFTFQKTFQPGEAIAEAGEIGSGLYVVLNGRAEVIEAEGTDHAKVLATLGVGQPFGELALLGEWKRTATVRAAERTTCLGLDRWQFLAHLQKEPAVAVKMLQYVAQRLINNELRVAAGA